MISTICRENLKAIAQAYGKATGQSLTAISKKFYGNGTFLEAFFSGAQSISIDKYDAMIAELVERWPEEAKWPLLRVIVVRGPVRKEKVSLSPAPLVQDRENRLPPRNAAAPGKRRSS